MRIVRNFVETRGKEGMTEEEAQNVCAWANEVRIGQSMLDLVLANKVGINLREDGEIEFSKKNNPDWPLPSTD